VCGRRNTSTSTQPFQGLQKSKHEYAFNDSLLVKEKVVREFRIKELKDKVKELEKRLGSDET
jgi:hypothetical protein